MVLDRTRYGREARLEVEGKPYEKLMEGIIIRNAGELEATAAETDPSTVDAEVVDESEPVNPELRVVNQPEALVSPSVPSKPYVVGSAKSQRTRR